MIKEVNTQNELVNNKIQVQVSDRKIQILPTVSYKELDSLRSILVKSMERPQGLVITIDSAQILVAKLLEDENYDQPGIFKNQLSISDAQTGKKIAYCNAFVAEPSAFEVYKGYESLEYIKKYEKKGIIKLAFSLFFEYLKVRDVTTVTGETARGNTASILSRFNIPVAINTVENAEYYVTTIRRGATGIILITDLLNTTQKKYTESDIQDMLLAI